MLWKLLLYFFIFSLFIAIETFAQNLTFITKEVAGEYYRGGSWTSETITLNEDGTYYVRWTSDDCEVESANSRDCINHYKEWGIYSTNSNKVEFYMTRYTGNVNKKFEDKSEYSDLLLVKWSDRIYLVEESSLKQFSNAINLGVEPRKNISPIAKYYFFLRHGDEKKAVSDLPSLPDKWKNFLLKSPISATVIEIKNQKGYKIAVVDKGSKAGLKVGMQMVADSTPYEAEIISVNQNSSTIKLKNLNLRVGDKLTTDWDHESPIILDDDDTSNP